MSIDAMKMALEALEGLRDLFYQDTIEALRAAIEAAERVEPVGYVRAYALEHLSKPGHTVINHEPLSDDDIALYTSTQPATDAYELGKKDGWEACEACHGIVNGVIQQPAIPDWWVSVNERLPDHRNECLVYSRHIEDGCVVKQSHLNPAKTGFYVEYSDDGETPLEEITHWMPLPAAPSSVLRLRLKRK